MRKIYLSFSLLLVAGVMAFGQANYDVKFTATAPVIDGEEDELWDTIAPIAVATPFAAEVPTVGDSYVKMIWSDTALFVLFNVADDNFYPAEESGGNDYEFDKCEMYWDVNATIPSAAGPATANSGTWQCAPAFLVADEGIEVFKGGWAEHSTNCYMSHQLYGEAYVAEYRINVNGLYNSDLDTIEFVGGLKIGFDLTIIDQDEGVTTARQRAVWVSKTDEAWNTMAGCGTATLLAKPAGVSSIINNSVNVVSAYPNPVQDVLTIDAQFNSAVITNMLGQSVMVLDQLKSSQLDLATLPKGVYFISISQDATLVGTTRFIKE